jgi:lysophospholipase L1-like esterase
VVREILQVAAAIGVAALSWRFVEEPVRHGAIGRWLAEMRRNGWHLRALPGQTRFALVASLLVVGLASCGLTGVVRPPGALAAGTQPASSPASSPQPTTASDPAHSECKAVVHIGDSTSDGLISPDYLPNPRKRIGAQYARVGITKFIPEIAGGTSVVETATGGPNAYQVARQLVRGGYRGCWVLALGTNDTADVAIGSNTGRAARIREMMAAIGRQPVLWVNVKSLVASGPYAESEMQLWDAALLRACARYPNMRVYDWAAAVKNGWFINDGVHFTSAGYAARARLIANALAAAFPYRGRSVGHGPPTTRPPSCLVR